MIAYLRGNLCVWVGDSPAPSQFMVFDGCLPNAPLGAAVGKALVNNAWVDPTPGTEQANLATLMAQADSAIATNIQDIADANAWLATNTGTLSTAQLSNAMRSMMQSMIRTKQQSNAVIRLLRAKLDATT